MKLLKGTAVILLLFFAGCGEKRGDDLKENERADDISALIREGDIVFRRGGGLTSRAVLAADPEGLYSHVGIVVEAGGEIEGGMNDSGRHAIVHIVPGEPDEDGVRDAIKMEAVEAFFARNHARKGAVMRVTGVANEQKGDGAVVGTAETAEPEVMAGIEEEIVKTIVAGAAKKAAELAITGLRFDHDYDLDDTTRMYCTELVWRVFERQGLDLTDGKRTKLNLPGFRGTYILPTDIAGSRHLELIYRF